MFIAGDRWTCPVCRVTEHFAKPYGRMHRSRLAEIQRRHGDAHAARRRAVWDYRKTELLSRPRKAA